MSESKQIVITGISSELGAIIARTLATDPEIKIIGTMRRLLLKGKEEFSQNIHILDNCDLTKPECCSKLAATTNQLFNGPFGLIHSVGDFWNHVPFLDIGPIKGHHMFDSHVTTFYNVLQALIPLMQAKGGGSTIAFSCNSVRYNYPWMAAFTAAKSAVESLVRSLANEFSAESMRFNTIALASVKTTKVQQSKPHGDYEHFIPPEDIVPVVRFLLSAQSYLVNGNSINLFQHSDSFYHKGYFERVST